MMDPMRGNNGPRYKHTADAGAPYDTITIDKLTPIIGFSELLRSNLSVEAKEHASLIVRSAQEASRIIRQLLQLSKPEAGHPRRIDLRGVVEDALLMLKFQIRERRCALTTSLASEPVVIMADAAQIISVAAGRHVAYRDTDREEWIAAMVSSGVPAEYAQVLRPLTATLASGNGARPNSDVLDVTGTAPLTFAEFAAKTAPAWK